jgi:curved DNA-binding protein CbpA
MVDESLIKQQYGKLALLLHCNKNEFVRFKATFKVIGDVVNVLFNMQKQLIHGVDWICLGEWFLICFLFK